MRCLYLEGAGCYGRNGHEDAAADAALLAKAVGKPVRVQWSRADEHGWDPKGPPTLIDLRASMDDAGNVTAWEFEVLHSRRPGRNSTSRWSRPDLTGMPTAPVSFPGNIFQMSAIPYKFPNVRTVCHRLETTPLRPSWIRTPGRMQNTYANECFMDELAAAAKADPFEFRRKYLDPNDKRGLEVLDRLIALAKWEKRPSPQRQSAAATSLSGRGMSYVKYELVRTYVGTVAEVEVDRTTGEIRVPKFYLVHDCGQIINPDGLKNQLEGNVIQTREPDADRGAEVRPRAGHEPRLGKLSDPDLPAGARDRPGADRPAERAAVGRGRAGGAVIRRRSRTRCSTPSACGCVRCRSRRTR